MSDLDLANVTTTMFIARMKTSRAKVAESQAAIRNTEGEFYAEHVRTLRVYDAAINAAEAERALVITGSDAPSTPAR